MHPAINKMVAPSDKRPGIWRNGVCQIMITRACNLSCVHCTAGSNLAGKPMMMSVDQFRTACETLSTYFGVIGVFGGNPPIHKDFDKICEVMRGTVPFAQRGLWSNALLGKGAHARITFNPKVSNLNTHLDVDAANEFARDWPESKPYLKGNEQDSIHSSPWVGMKDLGIPEEERWNLISTCDINRHWSSLVGVYRGELRVWFCEIAAHQAMLNENNPDWPGDTGLPCTFEWWKRPMADFAHQVETHCHNCGIPMRRKGLPALSDGPEQFSATHAHIARPKIRDRAVEFVSVETLSRTDRPSTQYLPGVTPGYKG